jgi:hypothetical protein
MTLIDASLDSEGPVEHSVPMERFPNGIEFPADLKKRIRYDPIRRRLVFIGFMSKSEFDRLCQLSDDWSFRRPLEDLFRLCTPEEPRSGVFNRVRSALGLL